MVIRDITTIEDLVAALSARKRYLEYGFEDEDGDEYGMTFAVMQGPETGVMVAWVDPKVARAWIDDGHDGTHFDGPFCSTWHIPEHSGFRLDWIECGDDFTVGDTVQWDEGVFDRSGGKPKYLGGLEVLGEVLRADAEGWVALRVKQCDVFNDELEDGRVRPLAEGVVIRRARKTVGRRGTRRLPRAGENTQNGGDIG